MFEITTELLVTGSLIGMSLMIIAGGISIDLASRKRPRREIDIDIVAAVRDAPYHRLKGVLPGDWPSQQRPDAESPKSFPQDDGWQLPTPAGHRATPSQRR